MKPVPEYMNKGSDGPHVTVVHILLCVAGYRETSDGRKIAFDQNHGDVTAACLSDLQKDLNLDADGNFGPDTRDAVNQAFCLDFETVCMAVPGTTIFVQPDGTEIEWTSPATYPLVKEMTGQIISESSQQEDEEDEGGHASE